MSGSLYAWYGPSDLESLAGREVTLSGELELGKLTRLSSLLHSAAGHVRASLTFRQHRAGGVAVELVAQATVELVCQRCLEAFQHELAERVDLALVAAGTLASAVPVGFEPFELTDGRLQPAELVEDELIVAIPLVPKHARIEDCGSLAAIQAGLHGRSETAGQ